MSVSIPRGGRGVGPALVLAALRRTWAAGHRVGVLRAWPAGDGLYRRLGFEEVGTVEHYRWTPTAG